jgi:dTDP-4-dehydrorhamnose reductase
MADSHILLFGGSGQVGTVFRQAALPEGWHLLAPTRTECDFTKPGDIACVMRDFGPDIVINAAAISSVDQCEADPDAAREINFHAVANLAAQCSTLDAPLIHLSTDYVFDGREAGRPYLADDKMNPLNVYGQTKMMGEEAVRHAIHWHVILRCPLIFSAYGKNILTTTLRRINCESEIAAVSDQVTAPASASTIVDALMTVASAILHGKGNGFGTFQMAGEPQATRFEFLQAIMESYAPYTDRRPALTSVKSADMHSRTPRPAYTVMNADKIGEVYGIAPHGWREDLEREIRDYAEHGLIGKSA